MLRGAARDSGNTDFVDLNGDYSLGIERLARTVTQFRAHNSDPMWMGRSAAAYEALRTYTETIVTVLADARNGRGNGS